AGGGYDIVHFAQNLPPDAVILSTNGSDVTIGIQGTRDRVTLAGWFDDPDSRVQEIDFCDGTFLEQGDITALSALHFIAAADDYTTLPEDGTAVTGNLLSNDVA